MFFRKIYCRYNDLLQHYNTTPFTVFVWPSPDFTSLDMTGYTLDSLRGSRPYHVKITLPGYIFIHLGFPECLCCIECNIYSRLCVVYGLMVLDDYFLPDTSAINLQRCIEMNIHFNYNLMLENFRLRLYGWMQVEKTTPHDINELFCSSKMSTSSMSCERNLQKLRQTTCLHQCIHCPLFIRSNVLRLLMDISLYRIYRKYLMVVSSV